MVGESCDEYVERERLERLTEHPDTTPDQLDIYLAGERAECSEEGIRDSGRTESYESTTRGDRADERSSPDARTKVGRREIEERMPRSTPDALRWEPGVYVQQTAHSQGSAYVR